MLGENKGNDSNKYAVVLTLHRVDIQRCGVSKEVCDKIDDDLLCEIAYKVRDALLDMGFWETLYTVVNECVELPERRKNEVLLHENKR